jgi:carbonic anhydrase/acetyltransferase-like protein (isoleucine patch superfamily)
MTTPSTRLAFGGHRPQLAPDVWVAPSGVVIGQVSIGAGSSVWFGAVVRGDGEAIRIGEDSNLQDGVVVHADPGIPVAVGNRVSVGHRAVLHGCTVGDDVLVGMGAVLLNGAHVGAGSLVAAGAVVPEGAVVPSGSLVAGVPGRVRRELSEEERAGIRRNAENYVRRARQYAGEEEADGGRRDHS